MVDRYSKIFLCCWWMLSLSTEHSYTDLNDVSYLRLEVAWLLLRRAVSEGWLNNPATVVSLQSLNWSSPRSYKALLPPYNADCPSLSTFHFTQIFVILHTCYAQITILTCAFEAQVNMLEAADPTNIEYKAGKVTEWWMHSLTQFLTVKLCTWVEICAIVQLIQIAY